jgi:hypothetical protein
VAVVPGLPAGGGRSARAQLAEQLLVQLWRRAFPRTKSTRTKVVAALPAAVKREPEGVGGTGQCAGPDPATQRHCLSKTGDRSMLYALEDP